MKKDIVIMVDEKTSMIYKKVSVLGINNENLQGSIIFKFNENFVDGTAWLEYERNDEKGYILMSKVNDTYVLPIKQSLLSVQGKIYMQLRITQSEDTNGIPVFKSNKFYLEVKEAINSTTSIKDDYPDIMDILNTKLDKSNIKAGKNIELDVVGKDITINASGSGMGGTSNYEELENKPKINDVELSGNKTLKELGINIPTNSDFTLSGLSEKSYNSLSDKPIIPVVPTDISAFNNDKGYITKDVNDLTNYTKTSDMPTIPTKVSDLDNDSGFISSYTETDPTVPSYVKLISENDINNWNNKANLSDIPSNDFYTYYLESRKSAFIEGYGGMSSSDFPFFQNIINKYRNKNTKPCILLKANVSTKNNSSTCLLTNIEYSDSEVAFYGVAFGLGSYTNIQSNLYSVSTMNIRFGVTTTNETITITNGIMCESFARKFLSTDNKISYTPTNDYNPATKKYVDNSISTALGTIETTLQTINSGSGV